MDLEPLPPTESSLTGVGTMEHPIAPPWYGDAAGADPAEPAAIWPGAPADSGRRSKAGRVALAVCVVGAVGYGVGVSVTGAAPALSATTAAAAVSLPAWAAAAAPKPAQVMRGRRGLIGTVATTGPNGFTVSGPRAATNVVTSPSTAFTQTVTGVVGDAAGKSVVVQGTRAADGSLAAAHLAILPVSPPASRRKLAATAPVAMGTVTGLSGGTLTLSTPAGPQKVTTTAATVVTETKPGTLAEIGKGDKVRVAGSRAANGDFTATAVNFAGAGTPVGPFGADGLGGGPAGRFGGGPGGRFGGPAMRRGVAGKVAAKAGDGFDVSGVNGTTKVTTTATTTFVETVTGSLPDASGKSVVALGSRAADGSLGATSLEIVATPPPATGRRQGPATGAGSPLVIGTVTGVSGATLTVSTPAGPQTVTTTPSTTIVETKAATLADLAVGDAIQVIGPPSASGNVAATIVEFASPGTPLGRFGPGRGFGAAGRGPTGP